MREFPLLDIRDALSDVAGTLEDVCREVAMLQADTDGHYPPDGAVFTANVQALLDLLGAVLPAAFRQAVDAEQTLYDEEEARWVPTASPNYQWGA